MKFIFIYKKYSRLRSRAHTAGTTMSRIGYRLSIYSGLIRPSMVKNVKGWKTLPTSFVNFK